MFTSNNIAENENLAPSSCNFEYPDLCNQVFFWQRLLSIELSLILNFVQMLHKNLYLVLNTSNVNPTAK